MRFRGPQALKDSHESVTCSSSPAISSIAFHAQPPNLRFASLIDMGFAIIGPLARRSRLRSGSCTLARVFAPRFLQPPLTATPLRFAITSPPSGCEEDFHLQAVERARRTKRNSGRMLPLSAKSKFFLGKSPSVDRTRIKTE